jgi:hypothetical protein
MAVSLCKNKNTPSPIGHSGFRVFNEHVFFSMNMVLCIATKMKQKTVVLTGGIHLHH